MYKTCCVTGHRDIPIRNLERVQGELAAAVQTAINQGFTRFLSGFAIGTDLMFARIIADFKKEHPITLEAIVPHSSRMNSRNTEFRELIKLCDDVKVFSQDYRVSAYMERNRHMVDESELVIAVFDGRPKGGTAGTLKYAQKLKKKIILIEA